MIIETILIGIIAVMILVLLQLVIGRVIKNRAKYHADIEFRFRFKKYILMMPDVKESKYYNRFPKKDGTQWNYGPVIDDPFMQKIADDVIMLTIDKSERYKAGFILRLTQCLYTYQKDTKTYGVSEKYAFPVCTAYMKVGDCEDGALFGASLSKLCGLDAVVIHNEGHVLYGVNVKGFGMKVTHNGRNYLKCETTGILPLGLTLNDGKFLGAYSIDVPPEDYIKAHTYEESFEKFKVY